MQRDRFRRLVQRALRDLPVAARDQLNNVEIVIEREPNAEDLGTIEGDHPAGDSEGGADGSLFGLYVGIPLVDRADYHMTLPDRIVIFQGPLERAFHPRDIPEQVRITVLHEIAHHFGIDDERLHELGYE